MSAAPKRPARRAPPAAAASARPAQAAPSKGRSALAALAETARGDPQADRVVPPTGIAATLTVGASAAMAFLAVLALALSLAAGRVAERWSDALARTSTIRVSAPAGEAERQVEAVLRVLGETPGVALARALPEEERRALLEPWFGPDLPLGELPIPHLVAVTEEGAGYDPTGLRLRLEAEAPGAVLEDHARWRRPLAEAAGRLRLIGTLSVLLIGAATAAMVTLAASSALAANAQVIGVLRLVGARDVYIARAFVRRFTLRTLVGAAAGTALAMLVAALLPSGGTSFLGDIGFGGLSWLIPLAVPLVAALVAFVATRLSAMRVLRTLP